MKKIVLIMAALLFVAGNAFAFPAIDWSSPAIFGTDPQEAGIGLNYNISALYGVFTGGGVTGDLALRTDVYGVATLQKEDALWPNSAYYVWNLDLNGDNSVDVKAILNMDDSSNVHYTVNGTEIPANWQLNGGHYEVLIPSGYIGTVDQSKFGIYGLLDGASESPDDRLPNSGWSHTTPEPGSAMLLVMGLLGFGGALRRKFMA